MKVIIGGMAMLPAMAVAQAGHVGGGDSQSLPYAALERRIADAVILNAGSVELTTPITGIEFKRISEKMRFEPKREVEVDGRKRDAFTSPGADGTFIVQISRTRWNQGIASRSMFDPASAAYRRVFILVHETLVAAGKETSDQYGHSLQITDLLRTSLTWNREGIAIGYDEPSFFQPIYQSAVINGILQSGKKLVCATGNTSTYFGVVYRQEPIHDRPWGNNSILEYQINSKTFFQTTVEVFMKGGGGCDLNCYLGNHFFNPKPLIGIDFDGSLRPRITINPSVVGGTLDAVSTYDGSIWIEEKTGNECVLF